jgi:hypothetical protein
LNFFESCIFKNDVNIFYLESLQKGENESMNEFTFEGVEYLRNSDNVDYLNARYLLINAMQGFAHKCESRTKFIVPLLFRFLKYFVFFLFVSSIISVIFLVMNIIKKKTSFYRQFMKILAKKVSF